MTGVDILPLHQSAAVALAFWGAVLLIFVALLIVSIVYRRKKRRQSPPSHPRGQL